MRFHKTGILLTAIALLAFILRTISAVNVEMKPDEMVYTVNAIGINGGGVLSIFQQTTLYSHFVDVWFQLFGVTAFTTRLPSIIFGTLAVILIFYFIKELFHSEKAALLGSLLFAVSGFAIQYNYEMDMMGFFFALASAFFFLRFLNNGNEKEMYLATVLLGLALLSRTLTIFLMPAYLLVWVIKLRSQSAKKEPIDWKRLGKIVGICVGIGVLMFLPIITYNYLSYKHNNITDYYTSVMLGIGKNVYEDIENKPWSTSILISVFKTRGYEFIITEVFLLALGIAGFITFYKRHQLATIFFASSIIFLVGYVAGVTGSHPHFFWLPLVLSIFAGPMLEKIMLWINTRWNTKIISRVLVLLIVLLPLIVITPAITQQSSVLALREYVNENIEDNAIVLMDPRIYHGIHAWTLNDKHYTGIQEFSAVNQAMQEYKGPTQQVPFYYIECGKETTCAWSTESYQEVASLGEKITAELTPSLTKVADVQGAERKAGARHHFIIHQGSIAIIPEAYNFIDSRHVFWSYVVNWKHKEQHADNYEAQGLEKPLEWISFVVLYLEVAFAFAAIVVMLVLLARLTLNKTHSS